MSGSKLQIGIVGLPNVGKSTLFNALTQKAVPAENFPFCTIDPSVGVVAVPDPRLAKLAELSKSDRVIPAAVEFVDIAGLVRGAAEGEGLGNKFLANIREVDVIAHVVRLFDDTNIVHVHGEVNPCDDIEVINLELIMADLETVKRRLGTIDKDIRGGEKEAGALKDLLQKLSQTLESGKLANTLELADKEKKLAKGLHLLTMKPFLFVLNKKGGGHNHDEINDGRYNQCLDLLGELNAPYVLLDAATEGELHGVTEEDRDEFRRELAATGDGVDVLIKKGYELLDLITFFTTGEKETRGWTITRGSTAPQAGAAIHTDFKDKFIRADIIAWDKLLEAGSYAAAREKGWVKTEGKEYIVKDGDVIEFRI